MDALSTVMVAVLWTGLTVSKARARGLRTPNVAAGFVYLAAMTALWSIQSSHWSSSTICLTVTLGLSVLVWKEFRGGWASNLGAAAIIGATGLLVGALLEVGRHQDPTTYWYVSGYMSGFAHSLVIVAWVAELAACVRRAEQDSA